MTPRCLFIGTARGIENRLVPAAGFPLQLVRVGRTEKCQPDDAAENGVRSAACRLGCEPHAQRICSRRGDRRGRICFRSRDVGGRGQAYSDAGFRAECGARIRQPDGRALCFRRGCALRGNSEIFSPRRSHRRAGAAGFFRDRAQARRHADAAGVRRKPGRARHQSRP